jgi:hypothetical protein
MGPGRRQVDDQWGSWRVKGFGIVEAGVISCEREGGENNT